LLTKHTLELGFTRPDDLTFQPGQKLAFYYQHTTREYTLINATDSDELTLCLRWIPHGGFSSVLAQSALFTEFEVSPPFGYFTFQPSSRNAVFVGVGTGIAPFVAYVRAGIEDFTLLHGVQSEKHLYYRQELASAAKNYVPCLSIAPEAQGDETPPFKGRVTHYIEHILPPETYDFYLCGSGDMIRDATAVIDRRHPGSSIFCEPFY
jgi:NAD(P)H-flavin reductase